MFGSMFSNCRTAGASALYATDPLELNVTEDFAVGPYGSPSAYSAASFRSPTRKSFRPDARATTPSGRDRSGSASTIATITDFVSELFPEVSELLPARISQRMGLAQPAPEIVARLEEVEFGNQIGEGAYAVVHDGHFGVRPVAIKALKSDVSAKHENFTAEVQALRMARHPNIVSLVFATELHIVTELLQGCTLDVVLYREKAALPTAQALAFGRQLMSAIAFLHDLPLLHGDLKPENIMVDPSRGKITLIDLGNAELPSQVESRLDTFSGSLWYAAPDVLHGYGPTCPSEIWTVAIIVLEMLRCGKPYGGQVMPISTFLRRVLQDGMLPYEDSQMPNCASVPSAVASWLKQAFEPVRADRPLAADFPTE